MVQEGVDIPPGVTLSPAVEAPCAQGVSLSAPGPGSWELQRVLRAASQFQDTMVLIRVALPVMKMHVCPLKKAFALVALYQHLESRPYQNHSSSPSLV